MRYCAGSLPGAKAAARLLSQAFVELTFPSPRTSPAVVPAARPRRSASRASCLRRRSTTPTCATKLTPRYGLGCKRPSFHNEYLADLQPRQRASSRRPPSSGSRPRGVRTADGAEHPIDVLVLRDRLQGLRPRQHAAYPIRGVDGVDLEAWWDDNRHQAYEGVSVPGFPNWFSIVRPVRLQRRVLLRPDRDADAPHRALPHARARDRRDARRGHARRPTRATSSRCSPAAATRSSSSDTCATRQQLLLRQARRRAVPRRAPASKSTGTAPASASTSTTSSDGKLRSGLAGNR